MEMCRGLSNRHCRAEAQAAVMSSIGVCLLGKSAHSAPQASPSARYTQDRMHAEEALAESQRKAQESEAKLKETYETRIAELHRENAALRSKIDRLEATGRARIGGQSYRESGGGVKEAGGEELAVLRRGLAEQEVLIRGYQQVSHGCRK